MSTENAPSARLEGPLAARDSWTLNRCSIDRALRAVGNRPAQLLLREAFYGTRRFDDFARRVGVTESVAAARLRELVAVGALERRPYREPGHRTRHEYVLTERGRDLLPVSLALMQFGDRHLAGPAGPPMELTHHDCGAPVHVEVRCEAGHDVPLDELTVAFSENRLATGGEVGGSEAGGGEAGAGETGGGVGEVVDGVPGGVPDGGEAAVADGAATGGGEAAAAGGAAADDSAGAGGGAGRA